MVEYSDIADSARIILASPLIDTDGIALALANPIHRELYSMAEKHPVITPQTKYCKISALLSAVVLRELGYPASIIEGVAQHGSDPVHHSFIALDDLGIDYCFVRFSTDLSQHPSHIYQDHQVAFFSIKRDQGNIIADEFFSGHEVSDQPIDMVRNLL